MSFSDSAIDITDKLLGLMIQSKIDQHPLARLLVEAALSVRDILCCWDLNGFHHIAYEQLVARNFASKQALIELSPHIRPPMESYLHKFSAAVGQGWQKRWFSIHNHHMTFHRGKDHAPHKALDLTKSMEIKEQLNGISDPELLVNIHTKLYRFRAPTDRIRCKWIEILQNYQRQREINAQIEALTVTEKLKLLIGQFYTQNTPKEKQFLFSTLDIGEPCPSLGDQDEAKAPFKVFIPRSFGKGKDLGMQFQFAGDKRNLLITENEKPYMNLIPSNILDFKYKTKEIKICLNQAGRKETKNFKFHTEIELNRFKLALNMFRRFNNGFFFFHDDALSQFKHLSDTEIQTRSFEKNLLIIPEQQLKRPTADEVELLPPMSPSGECNYFQTEDSGEDIYAKKESKTPPPAGRQLRKGFSSSGSGSGYGPGNRGPSSIGKGGPPSMRGSPPSGGKKRPSPLRGSPSSSGRRLPPSPSSVKRPPPPSPIKARPIPSPPSGKGSGSGRPPSGKGPPSQRTGRV